MLTNEQIHYILDRIGEPTVVEPTDRFPYRISGRRAFGYSDDPIVSSIQVALSIMLEMNRRQP
jgi:hypothetical protein